MKIFIGATEASSDKIAAGIVSKMTNDKLWGITGTMMERAGVKTLFSIKKISFIGLDFLVNVFEILRLVEKTATMIEQNRPDVVVFVDGYDFYIRVARKLKKRNFKAPIITVVAPPAWLYDIGRTRMLNKYFDKLVCIFPFEVDFFRKKGHKEVYFFGNPFLQEVPKLTLERDKNLVLITIGSRPNEIKRHLPLIRGVIIAIRNRSPEVSFFVPTTKETHDNVVKGLIGLENISFSSDESVKNTKMRTACFAIAKSGTNTSEIAARGLPMLVYYRIGIATYIGAKFILRMRTVTMINIVANKLIVPEFVQCSNNPTKIVENFFEYYYNSEKRNQQAAETKEQINKMCSDSDSSFNQSVATLIADSKQHPESDISA